jgi:serine/threonine protein kinase
MNRTDNDSEHDLPKPSEFDAASVVPSLKAAERFAFQKLLGRGASGAVYQAYDQARGATIAVKFLTALDPASLYRFKSEFRTLANLVHPNLLQLYELLTYDQDWLLTMELVEGTDFFSYVSSQGASGAADSSQDDRDTVHDTPELAQLGASGSHAVSDDLGVTAILLAPDKVLALPPTLAPPSVRRALPSDAMICPFDEARLRSSLLQLCNGLQALHRADRLHRDLKPANVLVSTGDARVVICDFGLALEGSQHRGAEPGDAGEGRAGDSRFQSRQRELAGTLVFMSPEQARAETLTSASDWYSVGVMLYQALTGRVPFSPALTYHAALQAKLRARPAHPAVFCPAVPTALAELALALLHPDPRKRAGYNEALAALAGKTPRALQRARVKRELIGRDEQLSALTSAFAASRSGSATIALVSGASGMGKSSLVHHFLSNLEQDNDAIVLRARCYEREELPYKAVDPLIDALSSHLITLDGERVRALVPTSIRYLAALFPALRQVRVIEALCGEALEVTDPRERRRLAFRAFRELCRRLALQRPLVLFIDDLQWGDRDSAPLFQELVTQPYAPAVLVVCAYRGEDEKRSPLIALLKSTHALDASLLRLVEVKVGALAFADAKRVALGLLQDAPGAETAAELIAREALGSPFFVRELAGYVSEHGLAAAARVRLDTVIQAQLDALLRESRDLLSIIAVAGRPVAHATISAASHLGSALFKALRDLEGRRLVLTTRSDLGERVECYHDRIREAAYQSLSKGHVQALHRALAEALEGEEPEDSDALLEHWRGAGERDKALHYALRGAERSEAALAFTRAADLYREALSLVAAGDAQARTLQERLGHALMLAGRGPEAALAFQELLVGATPAEVIKFRMLAVTQLLRGGKIVAGFEQLANADDLFGVRFPESQAKALVMLVARRMRIRVRGDQIVIRAAAQPDGVQKERLDAMWEVAAALSSADWARGSVYGAELMLRATDSGDPSHIAGACGLEAVVAAAANKPARVQRMLELAERASDSTGQLDLIGRVRGMRAVTLQLQGHWCDSVRLARESQDLQRRAARVTWDHTIMIWWEITSAAFAGYISDLATTVPEALRDADARGDVFAATSFRTHRCCWAWLALDRPSVAELHVDVAEREWTPTGYQFQHWHMAYSRSEIDLYRGTPQRSLERVTRDWPRGRLLRKVRAVHVDMLYTRARLALAVAREERRSSLLSLALGDARALLREDMLWSQALGNLLLAGAASFDSRSEALRLLVLAEAQFAAADMLLHVELARARRGELFGGREGEQLTAAALEKVRALGVTRPEAFLQMLAPFGR